MGIVKDIALAQILGGGGGPNAWMGQGAKKVFSFTPIEKALADTPYATWTPSTTQVTLLSSDNFSGGPFEPEDVLNYDYLFIVDFLFRPVRVAGATELPTVELVTQRQAQLRYSYYNTLAALQAGVPNTSTSGTVPTTGCTGVLYLKSDGSRDAVFSLNGVYPGANMSMQQTGTFPNVTFSVKHPLIAAKCASSYFTTAAAAELDQAKSKFLLTCDVYQLKRPSLVSGMVDSWRTRLLDNAPE